MLVIKCNASLNHKEYTEVYESLLRQASKGLILLTPVYEVLATEPDGTPVKVVSEKED